MSTEYQQVPSQQFYPSQNSDIDPWLITAASNMTISWGGKRSKREFIQSPVVYEDIRWSPSPTPTYKLVNKPVPSQYTSTASTQDAWTVIHEEEEEEQDDASATDSSIEDEAIGQNLYKTELCRSFVETGGCRYGTKCQFAHGKSELRPVLRHPKYKTEICKTFHTLGTCPYGTRCRFIHTRPKGGFLVTSSPYTSPYASPYTSPPSHSPTPMSRTPSPPSVVPSKWSSAWPSKRTPLTLEEEEDTEEVAQEEAGDGEVPDGSPSAKSRLAVFRTIC